MVKKIVWRDAESASSSRTYSFSYDDKDEMKSMSMYYTYASGKTEMEYKYIRNGNVIHRQKFIDGKFYKWSYVDYYLNGDGVVEKRVATDCAEDDSGDDFNNTAVYTYTFLDYTKLPLLEQLIETYYEKHGKNKPWTAEDGERGHHEINEFMYPENNMIWREEFLWKWYLLDDVYGESVNDTNIDFNAMGGTGWRGRPWGDNDPIRITEYLSTRSRNLLLKSEPASGWIYSFEYTKDKKGNITQVKVYFESDRHKPELYKIIDIEYLY